VGGTPATLEEFSEQVREIFYSAVTKFLLLPEAARSAWDGDTMHGRLLNHTRKGGGGRGWIEEPTVASICISGVPHLGRASAGRKGESLQDRYVVQ
jgi:hypothetical protein